MMVLEEAEEEVDLISLRERSRFRVAMKIFQLLPSKIFPSLPINITPPPFYLLSFYHDTRKWKRCWRRRYHQQFL